MFVFVRHSTMLDANHPDNAITSSLTLRTNDTHITCTTHRNCWGRHRHKKTIQIKAMTPIQMLLPSLSTHSRLTVLCIAKKKTVCVSRVCVFVCGRFGRIKKHKREMWMWLKTILCVQLCATMRRNIHCLKWPFWVNFCWSAMERNKVQYHSTSPTVECIN